MMCIRLKDLDKLINLNEPQLILFSGKFMDMLSGDIANNIMLKQNEDMDYEVLEIVSCFKEYLIKRMVINAADVDYHDWTLKDRYSNKELEKIGKAMVNMIETTKHLPIIIEQDILPNGYDLSKIADLVEAYANGCADRYPIKTLIILDISPVNNSCFLNFKSKNWKIRINNKLYNICNEKEIVKFIKKMHKISHKLLCPIIIIYGINDSKVFVEGKRKDTLKEHLLYINKINNYVDRFVIGNLKGVEMFNIDVYNSDEKIGSCKLKYNRKYRKFEDYNK